MDLLTLEDDEMARTWAHAIRRKDAFMKLRDFELLAPFEVRPPGEWRISKRWVYPTQCYRRAYCFILDNYGQTHRDASTVRLVHGLYRVPVIGYTGHAWFEIDSDTVFDGVLQSFYLLRAYARIYQTISQAHYTLKEAIELSLRHNHYGEWHNDDSSVSAPRKAAGH